MDDFFVPPTISEEAAKVLRTKYSKVLRAGTDMPSPDDLEGWADLNKLLAVARIQKTSQIRHVFKPVVCETEIAGVPVVDIRPNYPFDDSKVIIYVHGGAYTFFSASDSMGVSVPLAIESGLRVVSVEYTLAPQGRWQQQIDEVQRVITHFLENGYDSSEVAVVGLSAGGGSVNGALLKMRDEGAVLPGAMALISPWSDINAVGDSYETLKEAEPAYLYETGLKPCALAYADPTDWKHPYVSPVYGNYHNWPVPTLIQGGTKEIFLSNFIRLYQTMDQAGAEVKLDLYEGMWHAFLEEPGIPESKLALNKIIKFIDKNMD